MAMPNPMQMPQMAGNQQMRPAPVDPSKIQKQPSITKDIGQGPKRTKSLKSESGKIKKDGQTKSPTVKRPKEIQYSRLLFIQHYFNGTELRGLTDDKDDNHIEPIVYDDDKDAADNDEAKGGEDDNKNQEDEKPENKDVKKEGEDDN